MLLSPEKLDTHDGVGFPVDISESHWEGVVAANTQENMFGSLVLNAWYDVTGIGMFFLINVRNLGDI